MFIPIVVHKRNGVAYKFLGGNTFQNVVTEKMGEVSDEDANKAFNFHPELSQCCHDYPNVLELISRLNLKITK
jgi:hypothetical protein